MQRKYLYLETYGCQMNEYDSDKIRSLLGMEVTNDPKKADVVIINTCAIREKLLENFPHLDLVFGTRTIKLLPELISQVEREKRRMAETSFDVEEVFELEPYHEEGKGTAFVSVQKGCNKMCSYCIVPLVRGKETNRSVEDILRETQKLVQKGVKEITLIGQTVNSWKMGEYKFGDLLKIMAEIEGLFRIRS